ncbi:fungal-specific transcription factor domain-containing protein [Talaromyces proteolyticus]|uniref:Fungal-specific transcription factor domain-containing protein n=1 Tax=Talaromyces proteolyticus TaxID=1131652 RepID=A0AAD4KI10_9EURO|nr:fungal-specific transcription factor domain-containing protein [Talaromyces proteolyticus]KAH8689885.1 fungal-specific transcription factor domain-containing protein [Talaromyces proteolyticus]
MSLQIFNDNEHQPSKRPRTKERTTLACIGCKQKKLKCDGQSPKCQNCKVSGRDCLVEDPATGLYRPRDYLQSLESRVAYLESLLQEVCPDVALDHMQTAPGERVDAGGGGAHAAAHSPASPPIGHSSMSLHNPTSHPPNENAQSEDQHVDLLSSEVALLCLSAAGREPHYFGPSSAVSFSRIVSATMGFANNLGTSASSQHSTDPAEGEERNIFQEPVIFHPPSPRSGKRLIQAYFDNIHPQYPFLHRPTFNRWEEEVRKGTQLGNMKDVEDVPLFFVLMVYAIGSLTLGQSQKKTAEMYYSMALDHISPVLASNSLESIQCILSCAVYSIRSPVGVSLWKISGMAIRHCIELGYHRSTALYHRGVDTLTRELIKRCFWVGYDIDRVAAFTLGRPVGIPEECIDVELPADIDDEYITPLGLERNPRNVGEPPTLMTGALHVIRLRRLWAKFSQSLYTKGDHRDDGTVDSLRQELDDWHAALPGQFTSSRPRPLSVFASTEWFQLAYAHSILLLYRPYITSSLSHSRPTIEIHDPERIDRVFEECSVRAREMCLLYRRLYQSSTIQFTWGSLHILFLGGLTYLYCLWRSQKVREMTSQAEVITTCMACSTVLVIIAERWNLATSYRDLFETLSERTISMVFGDSGNAPALSQQLPQRSMVDANAGDHLLGETLFQDWITGLGGVSVPQESEWLVQELLQGDVQLLPGTFYNGDMNM